MYKVEETVLNTIKEFKTFDEAASYVENQVKEKAYEAYDNNQIDKYTLQDILFDNNNYIKEQMGFEYDQLPDLCFKISKIA